MEPLILVAFGADCVEGNRTKRAPLRKDGARWMSDGDLRLLWGPQGRKVGQMSRLEDLEFFLGGFKIAPGDFCKAGSIVTPITRCGIFLRNLGGLHSLGFDQP